MWNVMLDPLPTEYKGYPIDSDYQTGIQIYQIFNDKELTKRERVATALHLLFFDNNKLPDIETAQEGLEWFLSGWMHDNYKEKEKSVKVTDYDTDQWRIYAAFRSQYGINLNKDKLHFWEFMGLLTTLDECAYTRVIDIRTRKIDAKMSLSQKEALKEAKSIYQLEAEEQELSIEEQNIVDNFLKYAKGGKEKCQNTTEASE